MDFYILAKSLTFLFLSLSHPTTLVFEEPVEYVSAGKTGDFHIHRANNQKILVIRALRSFGETDMIILTKENHYQFKLKEVYQNQGNGKSHSFINIYEGAINKSFSKKLETQDFRIFEGSTSTWVVNKKKESLLVNEKEISKEGYFSKGSPILINDKRVMY